MLRTYLYIPDHLEIKIASKALEEKKSKAEVIRQTLEAGFASLEKQKPAGVEVLLKLVEMAEKLKVRGPRDGSINHDYYLWGLPKRNPRIKP